jgi:integrin alpha 8
LNEQLKTAEGSPNDDDSYLGYSVTTGDFDGNGDRTDVAVGMPRGGNLTGTVRTKKSIDKNWNKKQNSFIF